MLERHDGEFLEFFKSLANANRQVIVFEVFADKQEHTVGDVAERAGIAVSTASEHLAILKRAGVLASRKADREVFYRIDEQRVAGLLRVITDWLDCC